MADQDGEWLSLEQLAVRNWRFDHAVAAGLTDLEAKLFAESDRELAELRKFVEKGCDARLIARIVL
jgi:hypothetical protein